MMFKGCLFIFPVVEKEERSGGGAFISEKDPMKQCDSKLKLKGIEDRLDS